MNHYTSYTRMLGLQPTERTIAIVASDSADAVLRGETRSFRLSTDVRFSSDRATTKKFAGFPNPTVVEYAP